ncbi:MAG: (2Fe-2S) ferredoxin domain-containing protein [Anaeroplasma bactoclasticum]|nr:(2Fe-2S) ferredoxin domain-containing protein [Anaeroplasma bactoclasticum]
MTIQICIGSSCHLKGSQKVIELFEKSIQENQLEEKVKLVGSFCLGKCSNSGVNVCIDGKEIISVTPENFYSFFNDKVLKYLK